MKTMESNNAFTATHHALLFAWISRAVVERVGEARGEAIMRKAVRRYGWERGRRMALRAEANGCTLTMTDYIAWREWDTAPGEMKQDVAESGDHLKMTVHRCPWHQAWKENDLMPFGRFYCLEVDEALAGGFNTALRFDVISTRPEGAPACEFVLHNARVPETRPGKSAIMPWEYHSAHIHYTCEAVVIEEMGPNGKNAMDQALSDFGNRFGERAVEVVRAYKDTDFSRLPRPGIPAHG